MKEKMTMSRNMSSMSAVSAVLLLGAATALMAQQPTVTRTVLQQADISVAGREAVTVKAEIPMGGASGRHTHPGEEISYMLEGSMTLEIDGAPARNLKAGDVFIVPAGKIHNAIAQGGKATVIANYIVEKGKPLTTPAK
jgi:quercetin dioxygenase-like cupin family protein